MSSQLSILQKIPGHNIWTAPSRDQYLPSYFKDVCDRYLQSAEAKELKPVKVNHSNTHSSCHVQIIVIAATNHK